VAVTRRLRLGLICAGGVLAVAAATGASSAPHPRIDPLPGRTHAPGTPSASSPWQLLATQPSFNPGAMFLLTNGTVLVQDAGANQGGTQRWWVLKPSATGSYVDGTWSRTGSLSSTYGPLYYASAVLPDGRFIIMGGEYNFNKAVWTNKGAIYNPVKKAWTSVKAPKGSSWSHIGDAPSTVLANGTFMIGAAGFSGIKAEALLNESALTWKSTGAGKADGNGEEGWTLLPDGQVLTVDTTDIGNSEIYTPSTGRWTSAGRTPVKLIDGDGEIGPQLLRPNGSVFVAGATGRTAVYHTATGAWTAGPTFPLLSGKRLDTADAPGAVLPNGQVLVVASPGDYKPPSRVFDFNGSKLTQVPNPPNVKYFASNDVYMLVLPTGQILFNDRTGDFEVYNPTGSPQLAWMPSISAVPTALSAGGTYTLSGTQLGGLTQGSAYGDDYQSATNFPLVRITNTATGAVSYARTHGMTSMSVAPGNSSSVQFTLPAGVQAGSSTLVVVANGIASSPIDVTVTG
jgi:hypothetical protein